MYDRRPILERVARRTFVGHVQGQHSLCGEQPVGAQECAAEQGPTLVHAEAQGTCHRGVSGCRSENPLDEGSSKAGGDVGDHGRLAAA